MIFPVQYKMLYFQADANVPSALQPCKKYCFKTASDVFVSIVSLRLFDNTDGIGCYAQSFPGKSKSFFRCRFHINLVNIYI